MPNVIDTERSKRRKKLRAALIQQLGGRCTNCGSTDPATLEFHHVDGTTWVHRTLNVYARLCRFRKEFNAGVRIELHCRSCNAAKNQNTYGPLAERLPHSPIGAPSP